MTRYRCRTRSGGSSPNIGHGPSGRKATSDSGFRSLTPGMAPLTSGLDRPSEMGVPNHRMPMSGCVRPFERRDLEAVIALHERVMPRSAPLKTDMLRAQLTRIFCEHPWQSERLPSLVFEEHDGKVSGCLGVIPRPMSFQEQPIMAAVSHSFIVEPGSRSALAAMELARTFLAGPQELSVAEGGGVSRRIWECAGGSTSVLYSLCWTRPLQPGSYVLSYLGKRGLSGATQRMLRPIFRLMDRVAPSVAKPFRFPIPADTARELDGCALCELVDEYTRDRALRPQYSPQSSNWLLETLARRPDRADFYYVNVRDSAQDPIGWYLYYGRPGQVGSVVQFGARPGQGESVLDHLFYHARRQGLIAVAGQVDPALFRDLAARHCIFHHDGGPSLLVHSRNAELLQAIHRGEAFLTRLEGEWWISYLLS